MTPDTTLDRDMARSKLREARYALSCGLLADWPSAPAEMLLRPCAATQLTRKPSPRGAVTLLFAH